jgi:hypothetical protein
MLSGRPSLTPKRPVFGSLGRGHCLLTIYEIIYISAKWVAWILLWQLVVCRRPSARISRITRWHACSFAIFTSRMVVTYFTLVPHLIKVLGNGQGKLLLFVL